jgi:hypothetical protein
MFLADERQLPVGFDAARETLARLPEGGLLATAAAEAFGDGLAGHIRARPVLGVSRLVEARFRDLVIRDGAAVLTMRWDAIGTGGRLFPALDADLTLTPVGPHASLLRLTGVYRPPLGMLGAAADRLILHRVAYATIEVFMGRLADALTQAPRVTGTASGE